MSNDWLLQTGLVLFVENYDACVAFYRNVLELPLIKDQGDIIILGFDAVARKLRAHGVAVDVQTNPWGVTGLFHDPDGNPCQLRNHFDGTFAPKA